MISAIPLTAPNKISFACPKASSIVQSPPKTSLSFWLGIVIKESTSDLNSFIPASAKSSLNSNDIGFVTIATASAPTSLAALATIGAAPVPVPPPIPAAIKTIFAPSNMVVNLS